MPADEPQIRISKPLPIDRESKARPSPVLSMIFLFGLLMIVLPLFGFIVAIGLQSQTLLNVSTVGLKVALYAVGAVLAYGFLVGVYHTFLAATGLDGGHRREP